MDLYHYFVTQTGRSILKNSHYFPIYERHFRRFVNVPMIMFEIGTGEGGSALMWKHYFGPRAKIVTIDIADKKSISEEQIFVRTGSQADPRFLQSLVEEFGPPDIVLDDGSHQMDDINASFDALFPRMSASGTYLVEDLDGAYWEERGGGLHARKSFIERAKTLVDGMNALYVRGEDRSKVVQQHLFSVSFYQMIVVIEKTAYLNRKMMRMPGPRLP